MTKKKYLSLNQLIAQAEKDCSEMFPWDVEELFESSDTAKSQTLLVDIREPYEFEAMHIENSINIPRGLLETACEWAYDETVPELVKARQKKIILICRSGNRSLLAAQTLSIMGYEDVHSLKTGLRGWNEYDLPLINKQGPVDADDADEYHQAHVSKEQMGPAN
ncbi:MAG: rhodanese-like domain-containing protein [Pseudomonadota bacterium]